MTTESTTDDAGAATGWSLADSRHSRSADDGAWTDQGTDLIPQIAIKGSEQPSPEVTIEADATSAVYREDASAFTLTRTGATTDTLAVTVELTQSGRFISDADLSKTVTFAAGSATAALSLDHQQHPAGASIGSGTLTATVVDGTDYDVGTPGTAEMAIIVALTVGFDMDSYSVNEEDGPLEVKLVARTGVGATVPDRDVYLSVSSRAGAAEGAEFPAISPEDYGAVSAVPGFLTSDFSPDGNVFKAEYTISIPIIDDDIDEIDKTFFLILEASPGTLDKFFNFVDSSGGVMCDLGNCLTPITIVNTDTFNPDTFVTVSEPDGQDFPDDGATRGRVVVGANGATGFLSTSDTGAGGDAFKISLEAGRRYRVEVLVDAYRDVGYGGTFPGSPVLRNYLKILTHKGIG